MRSRELGNIDPNSKSDRETYAKFILSDPRLNRFLSLLSLYDNVPLKGRQGTLHYGGFASILDDCFPTLRGRNVLEVGAGGLAFLHYLTDRGANVTIYDYDNIWGMTPEIARRVDFHSGDIRDLDTYSGFRTSTFDAILTSDVFVFGSSRGHIGMDDAEIAMRNLTDRLAPGGVYMNYLTDEFSPAYFCSENHNLELVMDWFSNGHIGDLVVVQKVGESNRSVNPSPAAKPFHFSNITEYLDMIQRAQEQSDVQKLDRLGVTDNFNVYFFGDGKRIFNTIVNDLKSSRTSMEFLSESYEPACDGVYGGITKDPANMMLFEHPGKKAIVHVKREDMSWLNSEWLVGSEAPTSRMSVHPYGLEASGGNGINDTARVIIDLGEYILRRGFVAKFEINDAGNKYYNNFSHLPDENLWV